MIRMAMTSTAIALLSFGSTASAQTLRIVATTSDLASLARSVAGELAQVDVMMPAGADPEAFEPRPSDLAKLRGASVIVRVGLGYDHWLDKLLLLHGMLHLAGYDHENDNGEMVREENRLRRLLGLSTGLIERSGKMSARRR